MSVTPYLASMKFPETGEPIEFKHAVLRVYTGTCSLCGCVVIPTDNLFLDRNKCTTCKGGVFGTMKKMMDEIGVRFPENNARMFTQMLTGVWDTLSL